VTKPRLRVRFRHDRDLWEVDYRDAEGKRRRPLFPTEDAAHEHATAVLRSQGVLPAPVEDRDITLRAYAMRWLATIEHEKDPNTVRSYRERPRGTSCPSWAISRCARSTEATSRPSSLTSAAAAMLRTRSG
jgi:hypothetical protein